MHEPYPGDFRWTGWEDVEGFIKLAQKIGFMVILRPGPYICAEWDFGGFPWWLGSKQACMPSRHSLICRTGYSPHMSVLLETSSW